MSPDNNPREILDTPHQAERPENTQALGSFAAADDRRRKPDPPLRRRFAASRPRLDIATLALALVLAVLVPSLAIGIAATWYAVSGERAAADGRLNDAARDAALVLDREFTGLLDAMIAFAASPAFGPDVVSPDLPALYRQSRQIAAQLHVSVGIARPDGSRVLHSTRPLGEPMPPMRSSALIRQVAETGRPGVSTLITGSISDQPSIVLAAPVLAADHHTALVVFASITAAAIHTLLQTTARPDGALMTLSDSQNVIIARSDRLDSAFVGQSISDAGAQAILGRSQGLYLNVGREGVPRFYAFQVLQAAPGWTVFVAMEKRQMDDTWRTPLLLFAIGAFVALALGAALAFLAARPILMPLRQLAAHARAIVATDGNVDPSDATLLVSPPVVVAELEYLRQGFAAAEATLRRRAEAERRAAVALAEREAQLQALFDASPIGLGRATTDGRVLEANDVLLAILGVSRDALRAGHIRWSDLTAPESAGITEHAIAEATASADGRCSAYTKTFIRPDGTRVQALVSFAIMNHAVGEVALFVVDVTESQQTQARLRDLLATVDMGAFMTRGLDGTIHYWSAGCERLYGWAAEAAVGREAYDLLHTVGPIPRSEINTVLLQRGEWSGDLHQRTRLGRPLVVTSLKRLRKDQDGSPVILEMLTDVTAQRAAEAALAESEAHLRAIGEASPDLIYSKDLQGRLTYANPALRNRLGHATNGLLGQPTTSLYVDAEQAERAEVHDRTVMSTGQSATFEEYLTGPDGIRRLYVATKAPLRDPATNQVIGLAAISRDVTEERANQANLAHLAAIVTSTPDAVVSFAASDGHILTWNQGAEDLFGYTGAEAVGAPVNLLVPHWAPDGDSSGVFAAVMQGQSIRAHETIRRTKSGAEIPVAVTAARMRAPDDSVIGVSTIFRDLRPRLEAEAALRASEARWRTLAECFPGFVVETDAEGRNTYINSHMQDVTGLSADVLLGDGWHGIIHPDDLAHSIAVWHQAIQTGSTYEIEQRCRTADGQYRWYLGRGLPQRDANGSIIRWWVVGIDITEIVAAREAATRNSAELEQLVQARTSELDAAHQRLAQAAKMEALGRLAGGVAHDFNNVLQAVQGGVALAQARLKTHPDRVPSYLNLIGDAAERGTAVTGRLLTFARRGDLSAEPVQPASLLDGIADLLRHTMRSSITLRVEAEPGLPPLLADKAQLETVLVNLANNARDAMPDGAGTISLTATASVPPLGLGLTADHYVRLSVIDNGAGMSPDTLERVSEPFFTTKPRGEGTGLGLAMARGFAEQSGGVLVIDSAVGRGTTVSLWLPLAAEAGAAAPSGPKNRETSSASGSVLVVDDELMVRAVVTAILADHGHKVTEASDAQSALSLLDTGGASLEFDALVTDLAMPGTMDGLALVREVRRRRPGLPVILLTGHPGDASRAALAEALDGGPFMMLHKPISAEALVEKLSMLLRG